MSERNAKLIRRWARRTGVDPHHPDNEGMWRIFRGNDPRRKAQLRQMLVRIIKSYELEDILSAAIVEAVGAHR